MLSDTNYKDNPLTINVPLTFYANDPRTFKCVISLSSVQYLRSHKGGRFKINGAPT